MRNELGIGGVHPFLWGHFAGWRSVVSFEGIGIPISLIIASSRVIRVQDADQRLTAMYLFSVIECSSVLRKMTREAEKVSPSLPWFHK